MLPEGLEPSTTRLSTVRVCQLRHGSNEVNWYRRRDSNPHCLVPKTSASSRLGYAGKTISIANCRFPICGIRVSGAEDQSEIGSRKSAMNWWTWHDLNVRPRPSQSRALIPLSYRSSDSSGRERAALTATSAVARSHRRNFGGGGRT